MAALVTTAPTSTVFAAPVTAPASMRSRSASVMTSQSCPVTVKTRPSLVSVLVA